MTLAIEPLTAAWRDQALRVWTDSWGEPRVVSRARLIDLRDLDGVAAVASGELAGVLTYALDERGDLEVVSIDAIRRRAGVGTALLAAAEDRARALRVPRAWLVTTNDNVDAQAFYAARGWRLVAVHLDALTRSRELKPSIPATGNRGIPIRDELEYEWRPASRSAAG